MDIIQTAYVLHTRAYRETSVLATFLTQDHGKINGVVRGVRGKTRSSMQKNATLQPFQKLSIQWRERPNSNSDLVTIRTVESEPVRFFLEGESSFCGLYLNEILYRLLYPRVNVESLFEAYQQTLLKLLKVNARNEQAWMLRQFEWHLLKELGVSLHADFDANKEPIEPSINYQYYPEVGAYPLLDGHEVGNGVLISGDCLLKLSSLTYCETCLGSWKRLLRYVLNLYLGSKPIMTRQLFK